MSAANQTVVMISLDTLRSDCLGVQPAKLYPDDYPAAQPPNTSDLDDLARRGAFFLNCISAAPYTSASHAAYFTGRWPLRNGLFEVYNRALRSRDVFQIGQENGYRTTFKTDFPLVLGPHLGFLRGVDRYLIEDDAAFLEALKAPGPHLAFAHFGGIHFPYGFHNLRYGGAAYVQRVEELEAQYPVAGFSFPDKIDETYRDEADRDLLLRYKRIVQYLYSHAKYSDLFQLYLAGIEFFLKTRFNPFLERLLKILQDRRYLLVLFGDHGEQWDAQSYAHHNSLHEAVLRVPLILAGPDVPARTSVPSRIRTVDLLPTLLEWMGAKPLRGLDGRSLWPLLKGEGDEGDGRVAYAQAYNCEPDAFTRVQAHLLLTGQKGRLRHVLTKEAVYEGLFKYVRQHHRYQDGIIGILPTPYEELFRIGEDLRPTPMNDPERCRAMGRLLDAYNAMRMPGRKAHTPDELKQFLQDFGYRIGRERNGD